MLIALVGPLFAPYSPSELAGRSVSAPDQPPLLGTDFLGARRLQPRALGRAQRSSRWRSRRRCSPTSSACRSAWWRATSRSFVDPLLMRIDGRVPGVPADHPAARSGDRRRPEPVGARRRRGDHPRPGHLADRPDGDARGRRCAAMSRQPSRAASVAVHPLPRDPAEHRARRSSPTRASVSRARSCSSASVNFLGLGLQPPAADWALMISENRGGLTIQPWAVASRRSSLIALLTIAVEPGRRRLRAGPRAARSERARIVR